MFNMNLIFKKYLSSILTGLIVIIILLVIIVIFQNNKIIEHQNIIEQKDNQLINLNNINDELNKSFISNNLTLTKLNTTYSNLEGNYSILEQNYSFLKAETNNLILKVETYKIEIEESFSWFRINSYLNESIDEKSTKRKIDSNCYEIKSDGCHIKLGCFYLINSEKLNLEYKYDYETTNSEDKLMSLIDFLKNKGGDCEDYALFFKAEFNYAKNMCQDKNIILEGWTYPVEKEEESKYWLNFQKTWYLDDVKRIEFENFNYPNIICGNLYDPVLDEISGHCMIAFTNHEIKNISDLIYLNNAYMIEPQDGSFQGNLNKENSGVYLLNEEVWYDDRIKSWVYSIITDNDYFLFNEDSLSWSSYSLFMDEFTIKQSELRNFIK